MTVSLTYVVFDFICQFARMAAVAY